MSTSTVSLHNPPHTAAASQPDWKSELNAKLEAHRQRRTAFADAPSAPARRESIPASPAARATAARVAARVAERYAKAPSYSEVLAANAAAASKAAETAAFAAQEAHDAARALLSSLAERERALAQEAFNGGSPSLTLAPSITAAAELTGGPERVADGQFGLAGAMSLGATIEHHEPLPARGELPPRGPGQPGDGGTGAGIVDAIAEATVPPAMSLPAKLIEFPRELIAAHKSRPRLAEGPLLEEAEPQPEPSSLRIFEVASFGGQAQDSAAQAEASEATRQDASAGGFFEEAHETHTAVSSRAASRQPGHPERNDPDQPEQARAPGWQSIRLGAHPEPQSYEQPLRTRRQEAESAPVPALSTARLSDRLMAALVDLALTGMGFLTFVLVFASCTAHPPVDKTAYACAGIVLGALAVFYQWLFLSYGCATPGMRYAQIALCTFDDENPTRQALRSRVWAGLLAALPLGLGLLWAVFDEDSLGWHDRMSRTYQRSYR